MSAIKLSTPSSGSISLSPANTASNLTITVPAVTGTMITTASTFAGTGPAFSAYQTTLQAIGANTFTKVQYQTELFDTNSCFDTSTYRFTPNVAGYYQVSAGVGFGNVATRTFCSIFKNGSEFIRGFQASTSVNIDNCSVFGLVYLNGTTDYIEIYGATVSAQNTTALSIITYFSAAMVRAA